MMIKDIMNKKPKYLDSNLSIHQAALEMSNCGFDAFPVVENGHLLGMLTMQDIVTRSVAKNRDVEHTKVKDVMTKKAQFCHENDTLEETAKMMAKYDVSGMPVLNAQNQLVGFVSMDDFIHKGKNEKVWKELVCSLQKVA